MKTTLLLPNGFKKIGWAIFVPAFLLGCSICFFGENFDRWLFRETVMNNIAIIGTVVGALFIGFSREKIEDEMIQHIRLNALMAAMWINYLLLIVVSLSIYNINYLTVMACGMATPLVIFLLVYHFNLYKLNRNLHHEKTNKTKNKTMKNYIRVQRAVVRLTQQQLAEQVGVSRQTINAIESSKFIPSTLLALKIARTFRQPVEAIFQLEEED